MKPSNLPGRLRNLERDINAPIGIRSVFEAISNGYFSICDRLKTARKGQMELVIHRRPLEKTLALQGGKRRPDPISDIEVIDDGEGLNDSRFDAFDDPDTLYNDARGGRGVGRLVYLLAFNCVKVESHFKVNGKWICRRFDFAENIPGYLTRPSDSESILKKHRTVVRLCDLKQKVRTSLPVRAEELADRVITHFMGHFVRRDFPSITVRESANTNGLHLDELFQSKLLSVPATEPLDIGGEKFSIEHVRVASSAKTKSEILLCGGGGVVRQISCGGSIGSTLFIEPKSKQSFVYKAYVTSPFLEIHMDTNRTGFRIADRRDEVGPIGNGQLISIQEIVKEVQKAAHGHLRSFLRPVHDRLWKRVINLVSTSAPQYRYLIEKGHRRAILDHLTEEMTDDQIDTVLHRFDLRMAGKLRKSAGELRESITKGDYGSVHTKFAKFVDEENRRGVDRLAAYVVHRRTILELLSLAIGRKDDGDVNTESVIHQIFAPQQVTSGDVHSEQLNLWIVDERLAFHRFLSSDRTLVVANKKGKQKGARPDVAVFDNPAAFSGDDGPYETVVIVEFKQPFRKSYPNEKPLDQVKRYIEDIRAGKAINPKTQRPIEVKKGARYFVYIICDMTPGIEHHLNRNDMKYTADGSGRWQFNEFYNAYIEVIPFDKMVRDAEKRNQAFFEKLDLPSTRQ